ncbi:unnamed protein product [Paramecium sonneborni]|uniref:Dihydroxyacetone kinase n=1 Tax=Paramecium sonneborni TaxID=65129 RepID=A0A8S1RHE2_9CILI|nr:unnamed protein product [Paramecium sonneborni]
MFINDPIDLVRNALSVICSLNDELTILPGTQVITLKNVPDHPSILCGGGSGHEPAHAGYVGSFIQAAVCGNVFTSPPYHYVQSAINYLNENNNNQGVLVIIKNYTGDIMNFTLAVQNCPNVNTRILIVNDDYAFEYDRRGLAGTVLLYKILSEAAKEMDLEQLYQLGITINQKLATIGVSLSSCTLPGQKQNYQFQYGTMEIGLGIHGEKGLTQQQLVSSQNIIQIMSKILSVTNQDELIVLLNNLGGTTDLEMNQLIYDLLQQNQRIKCLIWGRAMTSLEMHGISLTVLKNDDEKIFEWASKQSPNLNVVINPKLKIYSFETIQQIQGIPLTKKQVQKVRYICQELIKEEDQFNYYDKQVGDGDFGQSIKNGCLGLLELGEHLNLEQIGDKLAKCMGGSSGPILGCFIFGLSSQVKDPENDTEEQWNKGVAEGIKRIKQLGRANLGDRTLLDVLEPVYNQYILEGKPFKENLSNLISYAKIQAQLATNLKARKGRSRYLAGKEIGQKEPGCEFIVKLLELFLNQ